MIQFGSIFYRVVEEDALSGGRIQNRIGESLIVDRILLEVTNVLLLLWILIHDFGRLGDFRF